MTTKINPHHPPTLPSLIHHVALASKSFRVFGLNDPAWKNARNDWKRYKSGLSSSSSNGSGVGGVVGGGGDKKEKAAPVKSAMASSSSNNNSGRGNLAASIACGDGDSSDSDDEDDSDDGFDNGKSTEEEEEAEEMELICNAIATALEDDAGGFGTAGFHVSKVDRVQLLSNLLTNNNNNNGKSAVYNAKLIPHDAETKDPVDPTTLLAVDEDTGVVKYINNDEFYLGKKEEDESSNNSIAHAFQIRITVSKANEGLAAKKYYEALFAKRKELEKNKDDTIDTTMETFNVDQWITEDEELAELRQLVIDAKEGHAAGDKAALGYYAEMMLVEPHVRPHEIVISPPPEMDKSQTVARPSNNHGFATRTEEVDGNMTLPDAAKSVFQRDIHTSCQFKPPGPWERANMKAFGDVGLDVRKALVRVEFPVFPEGCKDVTFREVYQLNARLKSGSFATVCRGTHRATGKKIAVKCVLRKDLPPSDDAAIYDEVLILSTLRHNYICPLVDFFEERECYFLVMELMSGGDLFDRIGKRKSYTENDARDLCRKMLESVRYCHENSVAHCDMKPKNLLLVSDDDDVQMKLADFGFATRVYEPSSLTKQCGTPFFVAPEVLMRSPYDQQSDMWSCGVIMFLLLGGDLPFVGRSQKELFRNIVMGKYEFQEESWSHVSEQAKDLVKQLLVTDPSQRLSSCEAMASPWMRQRGGLLAKNNLQYTSQRLKGFNARQKLRASMICVSSVVSLRLSMRSLKSERSVLKASESKPPSESERPSFLDLPVEGMSEEEDED